MAKIVLCFPGTGDPGDDYAEDLEKENNFNDDVIRIYFRGCQHDDVGGGTLFPDLERVAEKLKKAFSKNKSIDLDELEKQFGVGETGGICRIKGPLTERKPSIESICLQGFSRGAVTCFAAAKKLDDFDIPIDIIANQPVPGQIFDSTPRSLYKKYSNLTECKNIRSATTFLASHHLDNGMVENLFFKQMVAEFSKKTQVNNWIMPHQSHMESRKHPIVPLHITKQFETEGRYATAPKDRSKIDELIAKVYNQDFDTNKFCFTPKEFSQEIFHKKGAEIIKDPIYLQFMRKYAEGLVETILKTNKQSDDNTPPSLPELTDQQVSAIIAIVKTKSFVKTKSLTPDEAVKFINLVIEKSDNGEKFTQIVNKTHDVVDYLSHVVKDKKSKKHDLVKNHSISYKKTIFSESYDYLKKVKPEEEDSKTYLGQLHAAQQTFEKNALDIDRGLMRQALKVIINGILLVTGLGMIANAMNKATTGDWFFLNKTRSTRVMRDSLKEIKADTVASVPTTEEKPRGYRA